MAADMLYISDIVILYFTKLKCQSAAGTDFSGCLARWVAAEVVNMAVTCRIVLSVLDGDGNSIYRTKTAVVEVLPDVRR